MTSERAQHLALDQVRTVLKHIRTDDPQTGSALAPAAPLGRGGMACVDRGPRWKATRPAGDSSPQRLPGEVGAGPT